MHNSVGDIIAYRDSWNTLF